MFLGQKIRGTFLPEPLHMAWGDVKNAVEDAGLGHVKLEAILLFSFASGPWKGAAFFQNVKDASLDFFHGLPGQKADELFSLMYDDICKDLGLCCTAEYGTPEHMKYVREQASQCSVSQKMGEKVKLSRFFSFTRKAREFESCWWSLACVLLYTGMLSRWWSGLDERRPSTPTTGALQLKVVCWAWVQGLRLMLPHLRARSQEWLLRTSRSRS